MSFAIGVEHTKTETNIGTLLRSAHCFGASMVFTIGRRYKPQASDTTKAYRHIPLIHFKDWKDFIDHIPYSWVPIGIEISDKAKNIHTFSHPKECVYILGAEDNGISKEGLSLVKSLIYIPTKFCLNVATAGSIVMYDRQRDSR